MESERKFVSGKVLEHHGKALKFAPDREERELHKYPESMWFKSTEPVTAGVFLWKQYFEGRVELVIEKFTPGGNPGSGTVVGVAQPKTYR